MNRNLRWGVRFATTDIALTSILCAIGAVLPDMAYERNLIPWFLALLLQLPGQPFVLLFTLGDVLSRSQTNTSPWLLAVCGVAGWFCIGWVLSWTWTRVPFQAAGRSKKGSNLVQ